MTLGVVLVGGQSRRFGSDKLSLPLRDGSLLIDRPITALREVLGGPVALVGKCSETVADRADFVIYDPYAGSGPLGGVVAALEYARKDVFILAGDLVSIGPDDVSSVLKAAQDNSDAGAVMAVTERAQPCIALYRPWLLPNLREALRAGLRSLQDSIPEPARASVPINADAAWNVNTPSDVPEADRTNDE